MEARVQISHALTFAGFDPVCPSVNKFKVAGIATLLEPGGSTSTATGYAGFLDEGAFGTCRGWGSFSSGCRGCCHRHVNIG